MARSGLFEHGYALLIGVDDNLTPGLRLPDVGKDLAALAPVLAHPDRCAYPPDQIKVIQGKDATWAGILDGLAWLRKQLASDSNATAVIYYSGHGYRDMETEPPRYYLAPYDTQESHLPLSLLPATDFAREIGALNPRRLLVLLDCCHAGGIGIKALSNAELCPAAPPTGSLFAATMAGSAIQQLGAGSGRAILCSAQEDQLSYLRSDGQMSLFTYHLVEALTGHAQPDGGAGEVLVSDVLSYVYRRVPASAQALGCIQTPAFELSGNFPIALVLGGRGMGKGESAPDPLAPLPTIQQSINTGSTVLAQGTGAVATGPRGVSVGGSLSGSIIVTGDHSQVNRGGAG